MFKKTVIISICLALYGCASRNMRSQSELNKSGNQEEEVSLKEKFHIPFTRAIFEVATKASGKNFSPSTKPNSSFASVLENSTFASDNERVDGAMFSPALWYHIDMNIADIKEFRDFFINEVRGRTNRLFQAGKDAFYAENLKKVDDYTPSEEEFLQLFDYNFLEEKNSAKYDNASRIIVEASSIVHQSYLRGEATNFMTESSYLFLPPTKQRIQVSTLYNQNDSLTCMDNLIEKSCIKNDLNRDRCKEFHKAEVYDSYSKFFNRRVEKDKKPDTKLKYGEASAQVKNAYNLIMGNVPESSEKVFNFFHCNFPYILARIAEHFKLNSGSTEHYAFLERIVSNQLLTLIAEDFAEYMVSNIESINPGDSVYDLLLERWQHTFSSPESKFTEGDFQTFVIRDFNKSEVEENARIFLKGYFIWQVYRIFGLYNAPSEDGLAYGPYYNLQVDAPADQKTLPVGNKEAIRSEQEKDQIVIRAIEDSRKK